MAPGREVDVVAALLDTTSSSVSQAWNDGLVRPRGRISGRTSRSLRARDAGGAAD
jgi:hypothetical protein